MSFDFCDMNRYKNILLLLFRIQDEKQGITFLMKEIAGPKV
jgi:hypothetical protein